jgi:nucleoside-diphosphate-sugar epimerase
MEGVVFVAGASGVVGRRVCRLLVEDGWRVVGTTRSPDKAEWLRKLGVAPVIVDVFDEAALHRVVAETRPEIVIHQLTDLPSGLDPVKMPEATLRNARIREIGTRHLVSAAVAAKARRLIAQSLAFAYAPGPLPYREDAPLNVDAPDRAGVNARGVASLEEQVLRAPLDGIVLRYGKFYGPDSGFDHPAKGGPLHVDAAADAARRAVTRGAGGVFNIAEDDGTVACSKAIQVLGWAADFRIGKSS